MLNQVQHDVLEIIPISFRDVTLNRIQGLETETLCGVNCIELQLLMRTVAKRFVGGVLTLAQPNIFFFFHFERQRCKFRSPVRAVAKGLVAAFSAGTPKVGAGLECELHGLFFCNCWFIHDNRFNFIE